MKSCWTRDHQWLKILRFEVWGLRCRLKDSTCDHVVWSMEVWSMENEWLRQCSNRAMECDERIMASQKLQTWSVSKIWIVNCEVEEEWCSLDKKERFKVILTKIVLGEIFFERKDISPCEHINICLERTSNRNELRIKASGIRDTQHALIFK